MKRFLASLLMACSLATAAHAQSDSRWVGIWYCQGGTDGNGVMNSTHQRGSSGASLPSETNHALRIALDRMGVPTKTFTFPDSAGGWARVMRATRPAGMADSTWFRQNGCMGMIIAFTNISSTKEPIRYFTDANANRGVFAGSPLDGSWSIPVCAFVVDAANDGATGYTNGIETYRFPSSSSRGIRLAFHDNGDSLTMYPYASIGTGGSEFNIEPSQSADVTRYIDVDSITAPNIGNGVLAWRYKNVAYWPCCDGISPTSVILGLSQLFRDARYTPRKKLNLHFTLDHVYPRTPNGAASDSFLVYVQAMNLHFSGMYTGPGTATSTSNGASSDIGNIQFMQPRWDALKQYFYAMPHSHRAGVGLYGDATAWDLVNFSAAGRDTSVARVYWNMMEQAISDTMGLNVARGPYRTLGNAQNYLYYAQMYILAQNGYTDYRAAESDLIGHFENALEGHRVMTTCASCIFGDYIGEPFPYYEPTTGKPVYVHDSNTPYTASANDSTWLMVPSFIVNDINGKNLEFLALASRAIVWDADFYFHPQDQLKGSSTNTNLILNSPMRRLMYFLNRVKNVVTSEPFYQPRNMAAPR